MAESSLSIGKPELTQAIGKFLGFGSTILDWTAAQVTEIESLMASGVRRVYFPPAISQEITGYEWSWLRPSTTLLLGASGTDGSVSGDQFDSITFANWVTQGITADDTVTISAGDTPAGTYDISSVATGAITLTSSPGDGTDLTFLVSRSTANYNLPDTFGRLVGDLHYAPDEHRSPIVIIPLAVILDKRSQFDESSYPEFAAIRFKASDGTTGSRQEILFHPKPDIALTLYYEYEAYTGALTDGAPYPLGGMQYAELYIESCLAVCESRMTDEAGIHTAQFSTLLLDAITRDRKRSARNFGQMGGGEELFKEFRRGYTAGTYPITYKEVLI